jgi:hypothetical protein
VYAGRYLEDCCLCCCFGERTAFQLAAAASRAKSIWRALLDQAHGQISHFAHATQYKYSKRHATHLLCAQVVLVVLSQSPLPACDIARCPPVLSSPTAHALISRKLRGPTRPLSRRLRSVVWSCCLALLEMPMPAATVEMWAKLVGLTAGKRYPQQESPS